MYNKLVENIKSLSNEPIDEEKFNKWILQNDTLEFLKNHLSSDDIIIYASLERIFMHTIIVPTFDINEYNIQKILNWNVRNPYDSQWGIISYNDDIIKIENCFGDHKVLNNSEQIIFGRYFYNVEGQPNNYFELNQKLSHIMGIHYIDEKQAWCNLDNNGDIQDILKIHKINTPSQILEAKFITLKKEAIKEYLSIENMSLITFFDFRRNRKNKLEFDNVKNTLINGKNSVYAKLATYNNASSLVGFQITDLSSLPKKILEEKYVEFIIQDITNSKIYETSCNPNNLANYFNRKEYPNLPLEMCPVYFAPEVLNKYKSDLIKYNIENNSISCRDTWFLEIFDINEAGQIFTYLFYLSQLPYKEQLYWKSCNEEPKATLSKRAVANDFMGQFYDEYDPLASLKNKLIDIQNNQFWWKLNDDKQLEKVNYVLDNSQKNWCDEISHLNQLIIEGFKKDWFVEKSNKLNFQIDKKLNPMKIIENFLSCLGISLEDSFKIMSPFHEVYNIRSLISNHRINSKGQEIIKDVLVTHESYKNHFIYICTECHKSIEIIFNILNEKV